MLNYKMYRIRFIPDLWINVTSSNVHRFEWLADFREFTLRPIIEVLP